MFKKSFGGLPSVHLIHLVCWEGNSLKSHFSRPGGFLTCWVLGYRPTFVTHFGSPSRPVLTSPAWPSLLQPLPTDNPALEEPQYQGAPQLGSPALSPESRFTSATCP